MKYFNLNIGDSWINHKKIGDSVSSCNIPDIMSIGPDSSPLLGYIRFQITHDLFYNIKKKNIATVNKKIPNIQKDINFIKLNHPGKDIINSPHANPMKIGYNPLINYY